MTLSLHIKILKIDKFGDFLCDIDYNSRTDVFRDVISLIINQCDPRRSKGASGGHKVSASRIVQVSDAPLCIESLKILVLHRILEIVHWEKWKKIHNGLPVLRDE